MIPQCQMILQCRMILQRPPGPRVLFIAAGTWYTIDSIVSSVAF